MVDKKFHLGVDMTGRDQARVITFALDNLNTRTPDLIQRYVLPMYLQLRDLIFGPTLLTTGNAPTLADLRAGVEEAKRGDWDNGIALLSGIKGLLLTCGLFKPLTTAQGTRPHPIIADLLADPVPLPATE